MSASSFLSTKKKVSWKLTGTRVPELVPDVSLERQQERLREYEEDRVQTYEWTQEERVGRRRGKVFGRLLLIDNKEGISPRDCSATVTALPGRVCSLTDIISNFVEDGERTKRGTCTLRASNVTPGP